MKYINTFKTHSSYESELSGGGVDFSLPNVSYCEDVKDVHFNPYNLIEFYVGEVTGTTPQTVKIYTDSDNFIPIQVSEDNKWYSYVLPKDKGLYRMEGDSVKNVTIKADINYNGNSHEPLIPTSTVEASFKGSNTRNVTNMMGMFENCRGLASLNLSGWNTSNVTDMSFMFNACYGLKSLDLSGWNTRNVTNMMGMFENCLGLASLDLSNFDTSKVTNMIFMFAGCSDSLTTIRMVGCSPDTVGKIKTQIKEDGLSEDIVKTE